MKSMVITFFCLYANIISSAQSNADPIPDNFVEMYYEAYSGTPTAKPWAGSINMT